MAMKMGGPMRKPTISLTTKPETGTPDTDTNRSIFTTTTEPGHDMHTECIIRGTEEVTPRSDSGSASIITIRFTGMIPGLDTPGLTIRELSIVTRHLEGIGAITAPLIMETRSFL